MRLPALAEEGDPMGRAVGAPLWPAWEGLAALERKRLALGDRGFSALFQQSPRALGGRMFVMRRVAVVDEVMVGRRVRAWDLAASEQGGDWTVGVLLCRGGEDQFQVQDVVRLQGGPEAVVGAIRATAELDGRDVAIGLPQDPGQAGRAQVSFLTARLAGWRVVSSTESGSKGTRAMPVASQANAGNMSVLRGGGTGCCWRSSRIFRAGRRTTRWMPCRGRSGCWWMSLGCRRAGFGWGLGSGEFLGGGAGPVWGGASGISDLVRAGTGWERPVSL